jgi:hypothetical protein
MGLCGHDGSEAVDDSPEPYNRRGFSVQEMSRILFDLGYSTTHIMRGDFRFAKGGIPQWLNNNDYVKKYLNERMYCLSNETHMIGVRDGDVCDTMGVCKSPKDFNYLSIYVIRKL